MNVYNVKIDGMIFGGSYYGNIPSDIIKKIQEVIITNSLQSSSTIAVINPVKLTTLFSNHGNYVKRIT